MNRPWPVARRRVWLTPTRVAIALVVTVLGSGLREAAQPSAGWADTAPPLTLNPVGDATVSSAQPKTNFGRVARLRADSKPRLESYVRFSVPAAAAGGKAVLRLWVLGGSKDGPKVRRYTGSFNETAITWNNRVTPLAGTAVDIGKVGAGSWAVWDVSRLVPASGDVTLAVVPESQDRADFASRESDRPPQLIVTAPAVGRRPSAGSTAG